MDNMDISKGGIKLDVDKIRLDLLPPDVLEAYAEVLTFGAYKYDDHNWAKGMRWCRVYASLLRHLYAWAKGDDYDHETGMPHLAHAMCCLGFLLAYQLRGVGDDDRFKVSTTGGDAK